MRLDKLSVIMGCLDKFRRIVCLEVLCVLCSSLYYRHITRQTTNACSSSSIRINYVSPVYKKANDILFPSPWKKTINTICIICETIK